MKSRTKADSPTVNDVIAEVAADIDVGRSVHAVAGGTKPPITILLVTFCIADDSLRRAIAGKLRFAGTTAIIIIGKTIGSIFRIGVGEEEYFIGCLGTGGSTPCARVVHIRLYYPAAFARGKGLVVEGIGRRVPHRYLGHIR